MRRSSIGMLGPMSPRLALLMLASGIWARSAVAQTPVFDPPPGEPSSQAVPEPTVELLYTGDTGGLDAQSSTGVTILTLWDELTRLGGSAAVSRLGYALARGNEVLLDTSELRADLVAAALAKAEPRRGKTTRLTVLECDRMLFVPYPPAPALDLATMMMRSNQSSQADPSLQPREASLTEVTLGERKALLVELDDDGTNSALEPDPLRWSLLPILEGEARLHQRRARYLMPLKPYGQAEHRVGLLQALQQQIEAPVLLSAGNEVSTVDPLDGKPHPHRAPSFATLARLGYDAVVPGHHELFYGPEELGEQLAAHPLPLVAANLVHAQGKADGEPVFAPYVLLERHGLRVAVIGIVGRQTLTRVSDPALLAGLRLQDAVEASNRVVQELFAVPETRPDLVVALGNLRGRELHDYVARAHGIDVAISDFRGAGLAGVDQHVDLGQRHETARSGRGPALITHSYYAMVGRISARFGGALGALYPLSLEHRLQLVDGRVSQDEELHQQVMGEQIARVARGQQPLLPPVEEMIGDDDELWQQLRRDPQLAEELSVHHLDQQQMWLGAELWSVLLANLLLDASNAEVALVRQPERLRSTVPGPTPEQFVQSWLPEDARLLALEVDGATLRRLDQALQSSGEKVAVTGLARGSLRVGGRPLVDKERYRMVMSSDVAALPAVARALEGEETPSRFELDDEGRVEPSEDGRALQVREMALVRLRALRRAHPSFDATYRALLHSWLRPQGTEIAPRWSASADELTVSFAGHSNYPQNAWLRNPGVRETRSVSPAYQALGLRGGLGLLYDSATLAWETRTDFKLARQLIQLDSIPGAEDVDQESVDDLVAASELRLQVVEIGLGEAGRVKIVPYANGTFDSEFTATKDQLTGRGFPHQKELRVAMGLVSFPGSVLQEVRLAGLFKNDFSVRRGQAEGGVLAGFKVGVPVSSANLQLGSTVRYFPDADDDTVEDLGLILESTARLQVPFTRDLSLALMADLFFYVPKVESYRVQPEDTLQKQLFGETIERRPALSLILSAGLSFDHLWKL